MVWGSGRWRAAWGQGTLEFALVSVVLMLTFLGVLDLGRAVLQRQDLANAAREGARFAALSTASRAKAEPLLAADIATAAAQRSPSLALAATNFGAVGGGEITCEVWSTSAGPAPWYARLLPPPGGGLLAFGGGIVAKKPPGGGGGGGGGGGHWNTVACSAAQSGDRLTVCAAYSFRPVASRLISVGTIAMSDCASVTIR